MTLQPDQAILRMEIPSQKFVICNCYIEMKVRIREKICLLDNLHV